MSRFILIFKSNQAFNWSELPPQEVQKVVSGWKNWIDSMGEVAQSGDAFKFGGKSVTKTGMVNADNLLTGYVTVNVKDFDAGAKLAAEAPSVLNDQGSIEIYELLPMH